MAKEDEIGNKILSFERIKAYLEILMTEIIFVFALHCGQLTKNFCVFVSNRKLRHGLVEAKYQTKVLFAHAVLDLSRHI